MADAEDMTAAPEDAQIAFREPEGELSHAFVERTEALIASSDAEALRALCGDLHEADMGALIEALEAEDRPRFVALMGADFDFAALTEIDDAVREELLEQIPNEALAEGVRELDSDDAVYILEDLDDADKAEVLERLPALERLVLQRSLDYPEDSVGRLMQTELIAVPPFWSVGQTIDYMRETPNLPERFYEIFVIDPAHKLVGSVPLDALLRSKRPVKINEILVDDRHRIPVTQDQEDAARVFQRYNLVSAPVVDETERLVGVLMVDDVVDVIDEEADEDLKALGGVASDEELSDKVFDIVKSRFPWLVANLLTALVSASVISMFENAIEKLVALAVVMPVIASMGGNAGTQTMTVAVRAIATRELTRANSWRVVRREMTVGLINGLVFALIVGVLAASWFRLADLGVVVALAMTTVLMAAGLGGIVIPLALNRLGVDPAVSSGPFVTTITDVISFLSVLGIATLWLGLS